MSILFTDFSVWKNYRTTHNTVLYKPVLEYEEQQKNRNEKQVWVKFTIAWDAMKEAVKTGLEEETPDRGW